MILSNIDIKREIDNGYIVLENCQDVDKAMQNCSVDITLGEYFYRINKNLSFINPWDEISSKALWVQDYPITALENDPYKVKANCQYILLQPGEHILGHTNEFIGTRLNITTMLKARSSMGRNNITICRDAGWGDIGYFNRYTLEITNNNPVPIVLLVNARIGQIVFLYTGKTDKVYSSKYQESQDIQDIIANWKPSCILPKAYKDAY